MINKYKFNSSTYNQYIAEIKNAKPLSVEEEKEMLLKIKSGDKVAKELFFKRHLKFVVSIAKEYTNDFLTLGDLINEGNLGLIKALERYDYNVETRFMSYAVWWVRQHITHSINKNSRTIRIPENVINDIKNDQYTKEVVRCVPLIMDEESNSFNISDAYIIDDSYDDNSAIIEPLMKLVKSLRKRDREIIEMYYGLNGCESMTLEEIGAELDISKERVRQVKNTVLRKLKHMSRDLVRLKSH